MYWGPKVWPYVAGCALTNTSTFSCILGGVVFEKKKKTRSLGKLCQIVIGPQFQNFPF